MLRFIIYNYIINIKINIKILKLYNFLIDANKIIDIVIKTNILPYKFFLKTIIVIKVIIVIIKKYLYYTNI